MSTSAPPKSYLSSTIAQATSEESCHEAYLQELAVQVQYNLENQHDWKDVHIHAHSPCNGALLPRPLVSGKPPRRVYIHPDELLEYIKANIKDEDIPPEREWVLPSHLREKWTLHGFADIFDGLSQVPPLPTTHGASSGTETIEHVDKWRETKRLMLATIDDDSTVVYYIVHDGIVKPRQN